jgi:type II secretory pathway component PulJ
MAMVLVAINAVFFTTMRMQESTDSVVDAAQPLQQALAVMRRDLRDVMPLWTNSVMAGEFEVEGTAKLTGQPVDLEIYTSTGVITADQPWGNVQQVCYSLRMPSDVTSPGKDLCRSVIRNVLATTPPMPQNQLLLSGVQRVEYSCFDGSQWQGSWDSNVMTNTPLAVRVRLTMASAGGNTPRQYEMVVPLDAQYSTNQATTASATSSSSSSSSSSSGR